MKIIHTGDWHLGRVLFSRSMLPEQRRFLYGFFLPLIDQENPDLILIAGDVFDRQIAPVEAIRLFDDILYELCVKRGIKTAVITGNHDGADRIAIGTRLLAERGLYICASLEHSMRPVPLTDQFGPVELWMLPYFNPAAARAFTGKEEISGFQEGYSEMLALIRQSMTPAARQILVAHCFVSGSRVSESETPLYLGGSGEVQASLFEGFDYVALGHLHAPQQHGEHVRYAGSPLKYSFDEEKQKKSVTVLELLDDRLEVRFVPVTGCRNMRTITGTLEELANRAQEDQHNDDFIYAVLTDNGPVFEPMAKLREHWPNLLSLKSEWLRGSGEDTERAALRDSLHGRRAGDQAVFEAFMRQICGLDADESYVSMFQAFYREVGGEEETL